MEKRRCHSESETDQTTGLELRQKPFSSCYVGAGLLPEFIFGKQALKVFGAV